MYDLGLFLLGICFGCVIGSIYTFRRITVGLQQDLKLICEALMDNEDAKRPRIFGP